MKASVGRLLPKKIRVKMKSIIKEKLLPMVKHAHGIKIIKSQI